MTDGILIEQERINSDSIPKDISQENLFKYFTLSDTDILEIQKCRGADNMIGFAIQLCALRMLGTFIYDFSSIPQKVINFVASQLNIPFVLFVDYPKERRTRWEHQERLSAFGTGRHP